MNWKAYNPAWATQQAMQAAAARWHRRGLLTAAQQQTIQSAYPQEFYRPGLFLRIGLFLFACLGALAGAGFLAMITELQYFKTLAFLCAFGSLAVLEFTIQNSRLYHAGADTALLYTTLGWFAALLLAILDDVAPSYSFGYWPGSGNTTLVLGPMLVLLLAATVRYADRLVAAAAYLALLLLLANWLLHIPAGALLLPFVLMLASAGSYWLVQRLRRRPDYLYYRPCLILLKALTLATFYLAGNYYVVREGNAGLSGASVSGQIPLAPLFYAFTALVPLVYIGVGLRKPSRVWLLTGLLAAAFSLFTLRYYRSVLPPESAAVLAGAVLLAVAVWAARYLRPARHGLTSLPDDEQTPHFNLESLVVAQTAAVPQAPPSGFQFGGGHSGGGAADGAY